MKDTSTSEVPWWKRSVIYQIYPRSFKDSTGDGVGDLEGIISKLDYLKDGSVEQEASGGSRSLGIDALWISPFYPSPMADFGYDVADYCDIDPIFGDLAIFDRLVAEAHQRGIKIILDYVPNHSSNQHPWFLESKSGRESPKRNWYIWRDPKPDGSPPNNWGSIFGGPAWTLDEATGQYYLHQFLKEQPDLNWGEPALREAMFDVLRFWLDKGVDGFRMDVVGMIIKDAELRDNPPNPAADPNLPANDIFGRQLQFYNEDQDGVHEIMSQFRQLLDGYGDRCGIGEIWYDLPRWVKYYGQKGDGLHMPFNFRLLELPWAIETFRHSVDELEAALPPFAWPNYVLGNHDRDRLASRVGAPQARVAAMLLLTLRGTPTLYFGDELGMENGVIPPDKIQDPQALRLGPDRNRDVSRTPMQWEASDHAGFSTAEPWLPVSEDHKSRNLAMQSEDPASMLNLYRQLLTYRRSTPALMLGGYRSLDFDKQGCFVFHRESSGSNILVALNFTDKASDLSIAGGGRGRLMISTFLDRQESLPLSDLSLRPHEGIIIEVDS